MTNGPGGPNLVKLAGNEQSRPLAPRDEAELLAAARWTVFM
jgi:hypothetical protein